MNENVPLYEKGVMMYRVWYPENGVLNTALFETWDAADRFCRLVDGTISRWTWITRVEL